MARSSISYATTLCFAARPSAAHDIGLRVRCVAIALLVAGAASADRAWAWTYKATDSGFSDGARGVAADPAGDIVAVGKVGASQVVVKLARSTGAELWKRTPADGQASHVTTDASGDVLVAAYAIDVGTAQNGDAQLHVLKLAAANGATLWETQVDAGGSASFSGRATPTDIVADTAGNPIVAVTMRTETTALPQFTVIKFSAATGAELWRYQQPFGVVFDLATVGDDVVAGGFANANLGWLVRLDGASGAVVWDLDFAGASVRSVAVDSAGDVAIGLTGPDEAGAGPFAIAKLAGASGATLWTSPAPSPDHGIFQVAVDAADDVVAAGLVDAAFGVGIPFLAKRAGGDGSELFFTSLAPASVDPQINWEFAQATPGALFLALGPAGEAFLTTTVRDPANRLDIRVWRVGATGVMNWTTLINGAPALMQDVPVDLVVADGDPIIAGRLGGGQSQDFVVIELDGTDSECRGLGCVLALNLGVLKMGEKFQKKWLWGITATGNPLTVPPARTADDPTTAGAIVTLSNPATRERAVFTLPAGANWSALGSRTAPDEKGYLYEDREGRNGPCSLLKLTPGKKLKLQCKTSGAAAPFTLDETAQGALDVHIQIGTVEYCLSTAGGELIKDRTTLPGGKKGLFKVKNAPPPMSCD